MGVSIREYARRRGVSDTAVRKALKQGRITAEADGTIDVENANREWEANTVKLQTKAKAKLESVEETLKESNAQASSGNTTYIQAKTANEVLKAQTNRVLLNRLKGDLINRSEAAAHVFRLARQERDAWQTWPARISSQMASELGIDAHKLHVMLERYVREHLEELSAIKANFK